MNFGKLIIKTEFYLCFEMYIQSVKYTFFCFTRPRLSVLSELLKEISSIINITNYRSLLNLSLNILKNYKISKNLNSVRLFITELLRKENEFVTNKSMHLNYCEDVWHKIVKVVIADTSPCGDVVSEKQLMLQQLILHNKLTAEDCANLMNSFMTNAALKRTECVLTIQTILKQVDEIGFDKTSSLIEQVILWLYGERDRNEATTILLNIDPVKPALIAETCALAVINFLDVSVLKIKSQPFNDAEHTLEMLQFKYNRKFLCLETHSKRIKGMNKKRTLNGGNEPKNCLFQGNYESLMRTLNFEPSEGTTAKDIVLDLQSLLKISLLMKFLLSFEVFDGSSYMQCPLIKRIGFFLSHLEARWNMQIFYIVFKNFQLISISTVAI